MRQLTYVGGNTIEWWDVPAPKLLDDLDALGSVEIHLEWMTAVAR